MRLIRRMSTKNHLIFFFIEMIFYGRFLIKFEGSAGIYLFHLQIYLNSILRRLGTEVKRGYKCERLASKRSLEKCVYVCVRGL